MVLLKRKTFEIVSQARKHTFENVETKRKNLKARFKDYKSYWELSREGKTRI
jgi:hypothetical protein